MGIVMACTGLVVSPFLILGSGAFHACRGSDRAKCILQIATIEKLMISYGKLNEINPGDDVAPSALIDDDYISALPVCPKGGIYNYSGIMPSGESGSKPYIQCDIGNHDFDPWPNKKEE